MAKITISGSAMVITSAYTLEDIQLLEKYNPDALVFWDADGEPIFRICTDAPEVPGSVSEYGACFTVASHDEDKKATITLLIPPEVEDVVEYTSDTVGSAVLKINKIEEGIDIAIAGVEAKKKAIAATITLA